jgi:tRNA A37 N6-isopentenylltransferase MiaA
MILKTISLVAISLVSASMFASAGAIAQVNNAPTLSEQTLREAQQQDKSPLSVGGSNLNLLQLINNLNLAGGKSSEQFRASQSESLDEAVSNFRNQQQREIKFSIPNK